MTDSTNSLAPVVRNDLTVYERWKTRFMETGLDE